ncbi:MAG: acyl--CoA ligase, partial [Acetobacteraceae bacterium]
MKPPSPLAELLLSDISDRPAIGSPGRPDLSIRALHEQVRETVAALNEFGIGRNDRVATVLNNGPEMAAGFIGIAAAATAAPLNPSYKEAEFAFYMEDLRAKALMVAEGDKTPAIAAAARLGIPVIVLQPGPRAGAFRLIGSSANAPALPGPAQPDDVALILHTSGTTSRPKLVPLSQRNIVRSATNVAATLHLSQNDRGLIIMPLFHIHGLIAGLLAPLSAQGYVSCTTGFSALKFFGWFDEVHPTWYTAVPTMHQAILMRAPQNREVIARNPLRFIRSSSSSMPMAIIHELEHRFSVPLIEAYGMTEAAHQMASNPLPPGTRKPGTVGLAAGPEIAIMSKTAELLGPNDPGEIVIRGANVTLGYENNPKANAESFTSGWFHTGDLGVLDADGYLSISGRIKEIINRGGEKISPREIDEILMEHPAVAQAVTFAIPHDKLGEEVGAAIVCREGAMTTAQEIREFVSAKVAAFKVPRQVLILEEIPKGATGKIQRIG